MDLQTSMFTNMSLSLLTTKKGELSSRERLLKLNLLPLCYSREINDLVFFYKALYGLTNINVHEHVSFVTHNRSRLCLNPNLLLKTPSCKTTTYRNSYFNRMVKLWNRVCKVAPPTTFRVLKHQKIILTIIILCYFQMYLMLACYVHGRYHVTVLVIEINCPLLQHSLILC